MATNPASIIEHPLDESLETIEQRVLASLRPMYDAQRIATLLAVNAALASPAKINWLDLAADFHALAGTAGHFGETDLGDLSRAAEEAIRSDAQRHLRLKALRDLREEIERAN